MTDKVKSVPDGYAVMGPPLARYGVRIEGDEFVVVASRRGGYTHDEVAAELRRIAMEQTQKNAGPEAPTPEPNP